VPPPADPALKAQALAIYREHGPTRAAERTGVSPGAVTKWAQAAGIESVSSEETMVRVQAARLKWEERRLEIVHEMGEKAAQALAEVGQYLDEHKPLNAKNSATTMAILVDKAQLLSGGATARTETLHREDVDEEIERQARKLEAVA
jgi:hypothetical protein